jgi:23S rRNA (pseudouridine1915-N3)-methyltransferase
VPRRIEIVAVGSPRPELRQAFDRYARLLRQWATVEVREVRDTPLQGRSSAEVLRDEGRRLLAIWPTAPTVVALAIDGRSYDSEEFATALVRWLERGALAFVVGGPLGLADDVLARADERLSLSSMTLPHQLARVVLAEQLFRGLSIARGHPYHR